MRSARRARSRGPLHGIPVLLKDNIATADRMTTTAGSLALEGAIPSQDAFVVAAAARGRRRHSRQDQPQRMGEHPLQSLVQRVERARRPGRNPYALDRNPSGSSSGSARAAAANFVRGRGRHRDRRLHRLALALANGIVGIKPTVGLVSRTGIIPISHTQDTAGPMTRTVADAAVLLGALPGWIRATR